jgi:hypothetical protein
VATLALSVLGLIPALITLPPTSESYIAALKACVGVLAALASFAGAFECWRMSVRYAQIRSTVRRDLRRRLADAEVLAANGFVLSDKLGSDDTDAQYAKRNLLALRDLIRYGFELVKL